MTPTPTSNKNERRRIDVLNGDSTAGLQEVAGGFRKLIGTWSTGLFRFILLAFVAYILMTGKAQLAEVIAASPAVVDAAKVAAEAKATAADAKSNSAILSTQVGTLSSTNEKIFEAIEDVRSAVQVETNQTTAINQRVIDLSAQVDRIEAKQDGIQNP